MNRDDSVRRGEEFWRISEQELSDQEVENRIAAVLQKVKSGDNKDAATTSESESEDESEEDTETEDPKSEDEHEVEVRLEDESEDEEEDYNLSEEEDDEVMSDQGRNEYDEYLEYIGQGETNDAFLVHQEEDLYAEELDQPEEVYENAEEKASNKQ